MMSSTVMMYPLIVCVVVNGMVRFTNEADVIRFCGLMALGRRGTRVESTSVITCVSRCWIWVVALMVG